MTRTDIPTRPRRQLSLRLLAYILLVSSGATVMLTAWQLWSDYDRDLHGIEERFRIIEQTTLGPLSNSVWALNEEQIELLLAGMLNLEAIVAVELRTDQGRHYRLGTPPPGDAGMTRQYPLVYRGPAREGQIYPLGELTLHASLDAVYQRLVDRAANILVGQALKTFVVSTFILLIVQHLVTRHLNRIADYARHLSPGSLNQPLQLQRRRRADEEPDELDRVEQALNLMRETLLADMARRESAERQLRESETRYRQLFSSSTDGLALFDLDGRLLTANPAFLGMLGYPCDSMPEVTQEQLTPATWHAGDRRILDEEVFPRGHSEVYRKELLHRDGHAVTVSVRTWTVPDSAGTPQFLMTMTRDVTRETQLEEEHRRIQQHMHEAQRLETIGTLAGGIAHEFNNLLTPIKGYAELLQREPENVEQSRARTNAIIHAAERGRKLVEKILLLGKRSPAQRVPTNFATLVRETLDLANLTRPPGVQATLTVNAPHLRLTLDPTQMHQAVMNLVINAFNAMPDGGDLRLVVNEARHDHEEGAELLVCDSGPGIPPHVLPRIFEPFYSTRGPGMGSGLGLAVVHGIVRSHGGDIQVSQSGNDGTTFRLWLPTATRGDT